jgi:hypothetical protein
MNSSTHILDDRPRFPYQIVAKRHIPNQNIRDENGYTFLLTHAVGYLKELWEPCLDHLLQLSEENKSVRINEIWSFDGLDHGGSVLLNEDAIKKSASTSTIG